MDGETRYSRQQINRIISSGSLKQKIRLFLRDRMGYFGQGFILTYEEIERMTLSVTDPIDRKKWEERVGFGMRLENGFKDLELILKSITYHRENLSRTLVELMEFEKYETIVNKLLLSNDYGLTPPKGVRTISERIIEEKQVSTKDFILTKPRLTEDGTINFGLTDEDNILRRMIQEEFRDLRFQMKQYLCYEFAMRKKISKYNLDVPEYEDKLIRNRGEIEKPVSASVRFEGVQDNRGVQLGECNLKDKEPKEVPSPSLRDMIEDYSVRVQDIDLTTDECRKIINEIIETI